MKAVLLIDIPDDLTMEDLEVCGEVSSNRMDDGWFRELNKEDLKPMPQKMTPVTLHQCIEDEYLYQKGWNDCLEEITGETE